MAGNKTGILTGILPIATIMLVLSFAATAQPEYEPSTPPQEPSSTATTVDQETIKDFAQAYEEVVEIQTALSSDLEGVADSSEARSLQQDAQSKMEGAVESNGLTVQEYNEVVQAMQRDVALRDQIMEIIGD